MRKFIQQIQGVGIYGASRLSHIRHSLIILLTLLCFTIFTEKRNSTALYTLDFVPKIQWPWYAVIVSCALESSSNLSLIMGNTGEIERQHVKSKVKIQRNFFLNCFISYYFKPKLQRNTDGMYIYSYNIHGFKTGFWVAMSWKEIRF